MQRLVYSYRSFFELWFRRFVVVMDHGVTVFGVTVRAAVDYLFGGLAVAFLEVYLGVCK